MLRMTGKMTLVGAMAGALVLGGCATTESVEKAQMTADQAMSAAQAAQAAASRAQSTADAAGAAAQRAQSTADSAASAAQAAASQAQATAAQVSQMGAQVQELQQRPKASGGHRKHGKKAGATGASAGERG